MSDASGAAPPAASSGAPDAQPTLVKDGVGLTGSVVFAMAGAAPGQTIAIVLFSLVAASAYGTLLPMIFTVAGLLCIAVAFNRLNMWRQNAGATFEWVSRAFNPYVGFMVGWLMLIAFTGFVLIDVITIGPSVLALIGLSPNNQLAGSFVIVVIGLLLTFTAVAGIRPSARLQLTVAVLEYSILSVFIVWAFIAVYVVHSAGTVAPNLHWLSFHGTGKGSFAAAMVIATAAVAGWDGGIYINEETERPEKYPGKGAVIGVALLGVMFILMFATFQGVGPYGQLQAHSSEAAAWVGQRLGGVGASKVIAFAVVISVLATTQVAIIGTARLLFSMSRDKVMPVHFGRIHPRYRTPAFSTWLLGGITIAFGIFDIYQSSVANAINDLVTVSGLLYALFYAITGLAAAWFYRRILTKSLKDAVVIGLLPLAGAGLLLWVAYKAAKALNHPESWTLGALAVLGIVMMVFAAKVRKAPIFKIKMEAAQTDAATLNVGAD